MANDRALPSIGRVPRFLRGDPAFAISQLYELLEDKRYRCARRLNANPTLEKHKRWGRRRVSLRLDESRVTASLHGLIDLADTDGDSVAYTSYGFEARAAWEPIDDWTLAAGTRHSHFDYDNPNVRTGFDTTRRDDQWLVFASIQWQFAPQWTPSVDGQCLDNDSNIPGFFKYDQTLVSASVRIDW